MNPPKDAIADFCRRHHIRKLSLFGSVLRDDFRADSDVDVLVEFEPGHAVGFVIINMEEELSRLFGGHRVDIVEEKYLNRWIVDFCCRQLKLIVELDGMSHDDGQMRDEVRERWLREQGYRVFRVTNGDVNEDLEAVARGIAYEAGVAYED